MHYLGFTGLDITHTAQTLIELMRNSCTFRWNAAIHLLKYFQGTSTIGLLYEQNQDFNITAYSDAD